MRALSFLHSKVTSNGADVDDKQHRDSAAGGCLFFLIGSGNPSTHSRKPRRWRLVSYRFIDGGPALPLQRRFPGGRRLLSSSAGSLAMTTTTNTRKKPTPTLRLQRFFSTPRRGRDAAAVDALPLGPHRCLFGMRMPTTFSSYYDGRSC